MFIGLTIAVFFSGPVLAQLRKTKVGDKIPEFSLGDANAVVFEYKHNRGRILAIAFLSPKQHQSEQAVDDIGQILRDLRRHGVAFDFIGVVGEGADSNSLTLGTQDPNSTFAMFADAGYKLWGKFGIVATPTVLIAGKDDVVLWIKAGYGYDFAPALRAHLGQALGLLKDSEVEESTKVKTLDNTSALARLDSDGIFRWQNSLNRKGVLNLLSPKCARLSSWNQIRSQWRSNSESSCAGPIKARLHLMLLTA
jgi:hypothetical protein